MKLLIAALLSLSFQANARTQPIFSADGSKATVMILGGAGDNDAKKLFDTLTVPQEDFNGKWSKKMAFDSATTGQRILSIVCVFSKIIADNGSCTLVLMPSEYSTINKGDARLAIMDNMSDAQRIMREFYISNPRTRNMDIYTSADGRLHLQANWSANGLRIETFTLEYR